LFTQIKTYKQNINNTIGQKVICLHLPLLDRNAVQKATDEEVVQVEEVSGGGRVTG